MQNEEPKVIYDKEDDSYLLQYNNYAFRVEKTSRSEQYAIYGCCDCKYGDITLPEKFTYDEVTYPITSIGRSAFMEEESLKSVVIPDSYIEIGFAAFRDTPITQLIVPPSVTVLGAEMCAFCDDMKFVWIQNEKAYTAPYDVDTWMDRDVGILADDPSDMFDPEFLAPYLAFPPQATIYLGMNKREVMNNLLDIETKALLEIE